MTSELELMEDQNKQLEEFKEETPPEEVQEEKKEEKEAPAAEEVKEEELAPKEEKEEPPVEKEEEEEPVAIDYEEAYKQLSDWVSEHGGARPPNELPSTQEAPAPTPAVAQVLSELSEEDYESATQTKEGFEKFMAARDERLRTQLLEELGNITVKTVDYRVGMRLVADEYFRRNPELLPARMWVALKVEQLQAEHPELANPAGFPKLLTLAGKAVKEASKKVKQEGSRRSSEKPAFVRKSGQRPPEPAEEDPFEKEVQSLMPKGPADMMGDLLGLK